MKRIFHLPPRVRLLLGALALAAGLFLSWALCGTDGLGLLVLLPFAVLFIRLNPELWRGR
ncbi:hypothetical protein [Oscillibacter sp.]|uniref:hypothetical protein n=1 Tax=Oscillibacter sp. TaxID=1945593 RepID=UPI00289F16DE|nr:hypothetical protein [Oscillibacter sp.]